MEFILTLANISGGILLGLSTLDKLDGERNFFNKIAAFLAPFQTLIGGTLVVLALLTFFNTILFNAASIIGGILLLTHVFSKVPALEQTLRKLTDKLMPFKAIIGIGLIVIGVLGLL